MQFIILFLSIIIGIKTISYGVFEIKENNNKFGGYSVIFLAIICVLLPNIIVYLKGI